MNDVGGNLGAIIKEYLDQGLQPRVVYDNFDFRVRHGQLRKDVKDIDNHWICQYVTFDRIDTKDNSKAIGDLASFEIAIKLSANKNNTSLTGLKYFKSIFCL